MVTQPTDTSRPPQGTGRDPAASSASASAVMDYAAIMQAAGEAAYQWQIDTDTLTWSAGASRLLGLRDASPIATGRG